MKRSTIVMALCIGVMACGDVAETWEQIRPSVFPLLLGADGEADSRFGEIQAAIKSAAKLFTNDADAIVPASIENIVVVEEETRWLVAFFRRGNDRTILVRGEEFYFRPLIHRNHRVVEVSKEGLTARFSDRHVAYPWHPKVGLGVAVEYPDETLAERRVREKDFADVPGSDRDQKDGP